MNAKKLKVVFTILIPLLFGLLLLSGLLQNGIFVSAENKKAIPTLDDPVGNRWLADIELYNKDLKDGKLSPEAQKIVEANKKYAEKQATQRADNLTHLDENWAIKQTVIAKETQSPSGPRSTDKAKSSNLPERGIHQEPYFPFIKDANFVSAWVEPSTSDTLWFLAGRLREDRDQSVLYIYHEANRQVERFYTSGKDGILRVAGFINNKIILNSEKGRIYYFDITTRQFFDETGKVLITFSPTQTPVPPLERPYP